MQRPVLVPLSQFRRVLILGVGNVGSAVASRLTALGVHVIGSTTRAERLDEIAGVVAEAIVLKGEDSIAVADAAYGCDAIVVTVSPPVTKAMTVAQRSETYRRVLVDTCRSATAIHERVLFLSSISVYGATTDDPVTEETVRSDLDDPSIVNFKAAEDAVLKASRGAVLRAPDIYGHPRDIDFAARIRFAHDAMGGSVPFAANARFNRIHVDDAADAVVHVLGSDLTGTYNMVPEANWGTNEEVFGRIADQKGLARLEFRDEIWTPVGSISSNRLEATGFHFARVEQDVA